jgi:hypothetical protein
LEREGRIKGRRRGRGTEKNFHPKVKSKFFFINNPWKDAFKQAKR